MRHTFTAILGLALATSHAFASVAALAPEVTDPVEPAWELLDPADNVDADIALEALPEAPSEVSLDGSRANRSPAVIAPPVYDEFESADF